MSVKKFNYSEKQQLALALNRENMLVSAGAGSGKTAVLVERIARLISEKNVELDRLLVLTFTRDGAAEFKTRIKATLSQDPQHAHKAFAIDSADITTIDAFSLKIVKKYGYLHNLDTNIINLDEQIESVLLRRSFDEVMAALYERPTAAFTSYAKRFLLKDDNDLYQMMLNLHRQANLAIDPEAYLDNFNTKYYSSEKFNTMYAEFSKLVIIKLRRIAELVKKLEDERHLKRYEPFLEHYGDVLTFDDFLQNDVFITPARTPNNSFRDFPNDEVFVEEIKDIFKVLKLYPALGDKHNMLRIFKENNEQAKFIISVYREVIAKVNDYKRRKNAYTFSDIARLAFKLVVEPSVNSELKAQYEYILIDEYQDTSDIQEALISQIATDNVYMVGDIKQSIYMFRNANSDIFNAKYAAYSKKDGGVLVDLNDNYRSRMEVLTAINEMLSALMSVEHGGANYKKEHIIGYGNKIYDTHFNAKQHVGIKVLSYDPPEQDDDDLEPKPLLSQPEIEADIIINDIKTKMAEGFMILAKENNKFVMRPVKYGDFTILISRTNHFDKIERRFNDAGIPLFQNNDEKLVDDKVIIALNALLKIFDHYTKSSQPTSYAFRFAVASFLRGFINNYSDQALLDLMGNKNRDFSCDPVLAKIHELAQTIKDEPVPFIVNKLVETFDFYHALNRIGDVVENTYKLMNHIAKVNDLALLDFSLSEIVEYFDTIKRQKLDSKIKRAKLQDDSVSLMTIHKSKGLEFPIVYYMDIEQNFYKRDNADIQLSIDEQYGFTMLSPGKVETMNIILSKERKHRLILSERIRLLYVALTRAKEKMIIIHRNDKKLNDSLVLNNAKNFKELLYTTSTYRNAMQPIQHHPTTVTTQKSIPLAENGTVFAVKKLDNVFTTTHVTVNAREVVTVSETILARGTLLHKYIEIYDFKTRKLEYIVNRYDRDHIKQLFELPIFKSANADNVYREYDFIDPATNNLYVIDMFIVGAREILLFDFKLVSINEPEYDRQLQNYAAHLQSVFNRPVTAYLVSIINLVYRQVEVNHEYN